MEDYEIPGLKVGSSPGKIWSALKRPRVVNSSPFKMGLGLGFAPFEAKSSFTAMGSGAESESATNLA